jgi:cysteinyl-tRNA synthetase
MGLTLEEAEICLDTEPFIKLAEVHGISLVGEAQQASHCISLLIEKRAELRGAGKWALADNIRASLAELGIILKDTPQGTVWRYRR